MFPRRDAWVPGTPAGSCGGNAMIRLPPRPGGAGGGPLPGVGGAPGAGGLRRPRSAWITRWDPVPTAPKLILLARAGSSLAPSVAPFPARTRAAGGHSRPGGDRMTWVRPIAVLAAAALEGLAAVDLLRGSAALALAVHLASCAFAAGGLWPLVGGP